VSYKLFEEMAAPRWNTMATPAHTYGSDVIKVVAAAIIHEAALAGIKICWGLSAEDLASAAIQAMADADLRP
jgi:hypothetical protein